MIPRVPKKSLALVLLVLVVLPSIVFSKSVMKVPAVDAAGEGILTEVSVDIRPGTGEEFVNIVPFFSVETQQSSKSAIAAAASLAKADRRKYDFFIKILANAEVVDGPSGGAAIALLAYSELTGKKVRGDLTVTGSISADGAIGKVGGIFKKAEAASKLAIKLMVVPVEQAVQDGVDLTTYAPQKWGMQVIEARKLEDVVKVALTTEGTLVEQPQIIQKPLELVKLNETEATRPLKTIAEKKIAEARGALAELNASLPIVNATLRDLNASDYQLRQGYFYSSANTAFLVLVRIQSSNLSNHSKQELQQMVAEIEEKTGSVRAANKTTANFEWAFAGELRRFWAIQRLAEAKDRSVSSEFNPALVAQAIAASIQWLDSVNDFNEIAVGIAGGEALDENKLRPLAARKLAEAGNSSAAVPDSESLFHLSAGRRAFSSGAYLTALVDAAFATAFSSAVRKHGDKTSDEAVAEVLNYSRYYAFKSAWAQLYFSHALYNLGEWEKSGDASALLNALKLQELALEIEEIVSKQIPSELAAEPLEVGGGKAVSREGVSRGEAPKSLEVSVIPLPKSEKKFDARLFVAGALLVLVLSIAGLLYIIQQRREEFRKSPQARALELERKLDHLDEMLLGARVGERNYDRLKAKYEEQLKQVIRERLQEKPVKRLWKKKGM